MRSKSFVDVFEELLKLKKRIERARSDYIENVKFSISKVKHGEPLKGFCDLCPRVEILPPREGGRHKTITPKCKHWPSTYLIIPNLI
jgi:hypothetical protein